MEILKDVKFQNGFGCMGGKGDPFGYQIVKELKMPGNPNAEFSWRIAQWDTRHSFAKELVTEVIDNKTIFKNPAKEVIVHDDGTLELNAYTSNEYEAPRTGGDWVHLLIEQVLEGGQRVRFCEMESLIMEADFEITFCDNKTGAAYNPQLHAAQGVWYITVENELSTERTPEGRPDYFWFGLPIFDSRGGSTVEDNYFPDFNTKKIIYCMGAGKFYDGDVKVGKRYNLRCDVLPVIKKAFEISKSHGFLPGAEFGHMVIGSTNFGWEIPGVFDAGIKINKISIGSEEKK